MRIRTLCELAGIALCGLLGVALAGGSFIADYLTQGWPLGWDTSGHFVISQLYFDKLWPNLRGELDSFFQGMPFPKFYPPLFYLLCGALYAVFPSVERVLVFKLFVLAGVIFIPSLIGILTRLLGVRLWLCCIAALSSAILICSRVSFSIGMESALTLGFVSQGLSATLLLALLCGITSRAGGISTFLITAPLAALFFLSNYHVIIAGSALILAYMLLLGSSLGERRPWAFSGLVVGLILTLPWYFGALQGRDVSPAIPVPSATVTLYIEPYTFVCLALVAALAVTLAESGRTALKAFATAAMFTLTIVLFDPSWLGLAIAWQTHRMFAVLLILLPIFTFSVAENLILLEARLHPQKMRASILFALIMLVVPVCVYLPPARGTSYLSGAHTTSIQKLLRFLKDNPSPGYFLTLISENSSDTESILQDFALSQYPALAGARGMWAILRESSFNSIFTT
ncbi:MAG: hypothetical protein EBZ48_10965, partial [Proteobacteria bacterium]|nr:hypothetical protein [Pseudomonadota bacterium]